MSSIPTFGSRCSNHRPETWPSVTAASCLPDETAYSFSPVAVVQSSLPMKSTQRVKMRPATLRELAAAMQALGAYDGKNTDAEHEEQATQLGAGTAYYRL